MFAAIFSFIIGGRCSYEYDGDEVLRIGDNEDDLYNSAIVSDIENQSAVSYGIEDDDDEDDDYNASQPSRDYIYEYDEEEVLLIGTADEEDNNDEDDDSNVSQPSSHYIYEYDEEEVLLIDTADE